MIHQAFALTLLLTGTLSLDPTGKYCSLQLDPTGKYNCNAGESCIPVPGTEYGRCEGGYLPPIIRPPVPHCLELDPTGKYSCNAGEKCVRKDPNNNFGRCEPDLDPTGKYCLQLDPTGKYSCNSGQKCQQIPGSTYGKCVPDLDPTGKYCIAGWKPPVPREGRFQQLDPTGKYSCNAGQKCQQMPGSQYGKCVPDLDPTGVYCVEDDQCRNNEKCGASGNTAYGYCVPELDPTGKYCAGSRDCRWYLLEKCVNGECQKVID